MNRAPIIPRKRTNGVAQSVELSGTGERKRPLLQIQDVRKTYKSNHALRGVSFDVFPNELVALLGPNGAGKTTLVRTICGRQQPDSGRVRLSGRRLKGRGDRAHLGFVPQDMAIYPDLTVEQNLEVFGRLHGVTNDALLIKVEDALRWTRLTDRCLELAKNLSGGMQRRLNIACGVLHEPRILLLDEPTVGVDPQSRERIFEMLQELKRQGTSILLTTHQLDEAQSRCDRIVIIDEGIVVASGTLEELIAMTSPNKELTVQTSIVEAGLRRQRTHTFELEEIARDLPRVLSAVKQQGVRIERLNVQSPTLQDVFLQLTGKELRE